MIDEFLRQLEAVPWFANIGRPIPAGSGVERLASWDEWPGPSEPHIIEMHCRQQDLYDSLMAEGDRGALSALWDRVFATVFPAAATKVPDASRDAWHAPSMAVWHAAWTAGLVGLCLQSGRPIPPDLREQWDWFVRGHWPSGYTRLEPNGEPGPLLVY